MFWGVIVSPGKKFSTVADRNIQVTGASLDVKSPHDKACLKVVAGGSDYIVCYLDGTKIQSTPLTLIFEMGEEIAFAVTGNAAVHLHGVAEELEESEEEESDEEAEEAVQENVKDKKKRKAAVEAENHIVKRLKSMKESDSDEEDESFRIPAGEEGESSDDDDSDELGEEEEGEDGEGSDEDMDDFEMESFDEESDEESDEEEAKEEPKKGKKSVGDVEKGKKSIGEVGKGKKSIEAEKKKPESQNEPKKSDVGDKKDVSVLNGQTESGKKKNKGKNKENASPTKAVADSAKSPVSAAKGQTPGDKNQNKSPAGKSFNRGGVTITTLHPGNGPVAKDGKKVHVYYRGRLKATGEEFDSNTSGKGFAFVLGKGEVVKGMEKAVDGMKVGEKRRVEIPPKLGYGAKGMKPDIPSNATLLFDIELKAVS